MKINFAKLNHVLIPSTKPARDRLRKGLLGPLIRPFGALYDGLTDEGRTVFLVSFIVGGFGIDVHGSEVHVLWAALAALLAGTLLVTPAPGPLHQIVLARLFIELANYLKPVGLAHPVSPGVVQTGPDTQLEPDILVISTRYPDDTPWRDRTGHWLAVEGSGRDSRVYDRDYKANAYLDIGVREVWRLDLRDRSIYVSRPGGPPDVPHGERLVWHPHEMPAPLVLDVRALFRGYQPSAWL